MIINSHDKRSSFGFEVKNISWANMDIFEITVKICCKKLVWWLQLWNLSSDWNTVTCPNIYDAQNSQAFLGTWNVDMWIFTTLNAPLFAVGSNQKLWFYLSNFGKIIWFFLITNENKEMINGNTHLNYQKYLFVQLNQRVDWKVFSLVITFSSILKYWNICKNVKF